MLTKKTGTLKPKSRNMNNDAVNNAADPPITIDNEDTPDAAFFSAAASDFFSDFASASDSASAYAAAAIDPDAHFLSSGLNWTLRYFRK